MPDSVMHITVLAHNNFMYTPCHAHIHFPLVLSVCNCIRPRITFCVQDYAVIQLVTAAWHGEYVQRLQTGLQNASGLAIMISDIMWATISVVIFKFNGFR